MRTTSHDVLACPTCHGRFEQLPPDLNTIQTGTLRCAGCHREFPITNGIPQFIKPSNLTGLNRRFSILYDWFSLVYPLYSKVMFFLMGLTEEKGRREITDRLDPKGGKVLEVSIGPGSNLPYIFSNLDVSEVFGLDISPGQLRRCQRLVLRKGWNVELFLGNGENLPFQNNVFECVLHVGGINFFNDKEAAIAEMIRVAKPGARILIADETEKGAKNYEITLPFFKKSFSGNRAKITPPIDLVPNDMMEKRVKNIWNDWFYCIEFRKP